MNPGPAGRVFNVGRYSDVLFALAIVMAIAMMVVPVPPVILDLLLSINLAAAIVILLAAVYTNEPLQFSVFPSLLLVTTLMRLSLNVSSTRLILLNGNAGQVIDSFGNFVLGGNPAVGFVVFLILVVVQFAVITKGAERVSEVAARFTLDAMPGKQMAIDADLNAGTITEDDARRRRKAIENEADFYGAMDGAAKFVKGDAIAGIIIVAINLLGGFVVGMLQQGMDLSEALRRFSILTVGDGLVSQLPALLISTATGLVVTRTASESSLGGDVLGQLSRQPRVMLVAGAALAAVALLVPGLPRWPFFAVGGGLLALGITLMRRLRSADDQVAAARQSAAAEAAADDARKPEQVMPLLQVDPLEIEFGYGLIGLADPTMGGDLMDRIAMIRRQTALDLGLVLPYIRVRDNMALAPNQYAIKLKGAEIGGGELMPGHVLAMDPGTVHEPVPGIATREPAFGLPALWIPDPDRDRAEVSGYTVVDGPAVVATHLTELIRRHAWELLGRQEVKVLVDSTRETHPALVEELTPKLLSLGEVQKVLQNLLREGVSIRDRVTVFEALADYGVLTRDPDPLTEHVRAALGRSICRGLGLSGRVPVLTLHPDLEERIAQSVQQQPTGLYLNLDPADVQRLLGRLGELAADMSRHGQTPLVLCSPTVRPYVRRLSERLLPKLVVLSWGELDPGLEIEAVGTVSD